MSRRKRTCVLPSGLQLALDDLYTFHELGRLTRSN